MTEFKYSNIKKEIQAYGFDGVVKSHCRMCHGGCGVLVYTKNGKIAYRFDLSPHQIVHEREYYRIFTHAFLHTDYVHLGINMLVLYSFGTGIENIFSSLQQQGIIFSSHF